MAKKASSTGNMKELSNAELGKILDETRPLIDGLREQLENAETRRTEALAEWNRRGQSEQGLAVVPATRKGPKPKAAKKAGKKKASERQRGERHSGMPSPNSNAGKVLVLFSKEKEGTFLNKDRIAKDAGLEKNPSFAVLLSTLKKKGFLVRADGGMYGAGPKHAEYAAWLKTQN